jgi:hypothetical protein
VWENSRDPEGFFYNAELAINSKNQHYINFGCPATINGKSCPGVMPPDEITNELVQLHKDLSEARQQKIDKIVDELVSGVRFVPFSIIGCDYKHYSPWLNLEKDLDGQEQNILQKAIKKINPDISFMNVIDYLIKLAKKSIGTLDTLGENVFNPEYKTDRYQEYKNDIVTGFDMVLTDLLQPALDAKKKHDDFIAEKKEKAKTTGEPQLVCSWSEDCDDPNEDCSCDNCYEYAMPDGTFKTERHHTW